MNMPQNTTDTKVYVLDRTGERKLRFTGRLLGTGGGAWQSGREQSRFTTISIYLTKGGKYVVEKEYTSRWQGERCTCSAVVLPSTKEVIATLSEAFDEDGECNSDGGIGGIGEIAKEALEAAGIDITEDIE